MYSPNSPEQVEDNIQRHVLGSATTESLLAELAAVAINSPQADEVTELFLKFKALAYLRPASCERLGEMVSRAEVGSLRMQILTDALESAGNPQAQAALAASIQSHAHDPKAIQVFIPALGDVESPTPQTVDTLLALAFGNYDKNVRTTARLALGNVARSLGDESQTTATRIVDRILRGAERFHCRDSTWELLLALGNAGSIEALPTLRRYIDDSAPNLRGAAVWALHGLIRHKPICYSQPKPFRMTQTLAFVVRQSASSLSRENPGEYRGTRKGPGE